MHYTQIGVGFRRQSRCRARGSWAQGGGKPARASVMVTLARISKGRICVHFAYPSEPLTGNLLKRSPEPGPHSGARRCCWAWDTGLGYRPTGHLVHVRGLVCGPGAVDRAWAWSHIGCPCRLAGHRQGKRLATLWTLGTGTHPGRAACGWICSAERRFEQAAVSVYGLGGAVQQ